MGCNDGDVTTEIKMQPNGMVRIYTRDLLLIYFKLTPDSKEARATIDEVEVSIAKRTPDDKDSNYPYFCVFKKDKPGTYTFKVAVGNVVETLQVIVLE